MSFFKPKFLLLALLCVFVCATLASGCTGDAFNANDTSASSGADSGGSSSGGSSNSGGSSDGEAGTSMGAGKACGGPEDCDDGKVCTTDRCNADGTCSTAPKCTGSQKCCAGDCAECCDDTDCDDGVSCTVNTCFSGQCMFVPNDTLCDKTQYCSANDGCRQKQACGIAAGEAANVCADNDACTTDSCVDNFCQHEFCADSNAKLCCEGVGCAACCNDSQCDTDTDPCTVGSCKDGKCSLVPLCGAGQDCCPSADHKTATCGACCSATDCDDKIGCTDDKCGGGQCSNTPNNSHCDAGYLCDPVAKSCVKAPDCTSPSDCHPTACQSNPRCDNGACHFDTCVTMGLKCCAGSAGGAGGCAVCCADAECPDSVACTKDTCSANGCLHTPDDSACAPGQRCDAQQGCIQCRQNTDCDDKIDCTTDSCNGGKCYNASNCAAGYCDATLNKCVTCTTDGECQGGVVTAALPIGGSCSKKACVKGTCTDVLIMCTGEQVCCPPFGCAINCGIMTN